MAALHGGIRQHAVAHRAAGRQCATGVAQRPFCSRVPRAPDASSSRRHLLSCAGGLWLIGGSNRRSQARQSTAVYQEISVQLPVTEESSEPVHNPPTYVKATGRIVAIGDLHGDWSKTIRCFTMAGVLDMTPEGKPVWVGGDAVVVQLGDVLDRGDAEIAILRLMRTLHEQATEVGGGVYMLNGNHESLNVCGDFRYVTPGAFIESAEEFGMPKELAGRNWEGCIQARAALYLPGGKVARWLSCNPTVLIVNDTAFAHGGLLPTHVNYGLKRMNEEVAAWMRRDPAPDGEGYASPPFVAMGDGHSVMWNRSLGKEFFTSPVDRYHACNSVTQTLARVGAKRLVVGHTPQMRGVNSECDGKVWRVDVGMSSGVLDAPAGFLEIAPAGEGQGEVTCRIVTDDIRGLSDDESELDMVAWPESV